MSLQCDGLPHSKLNLLTAPASPQGLSFERTKRDHTRYAKQTFKNIPKVSNSVPSKSLPEISRIEYLSCYHWDGNAERIVLELSTLAAELAIQI